MKKKVGILELGATIATSVSEQAINFIERKQYVGVTAQAIAVWGRQLGHEVHYAMVVILAMGIGLFAPPFGVGYFAACAIGKVNPDDGLRPIWSYFAALVAGLIGGAAVPWPSTGFLR